MKKINSLLFTLLSFIPYLTSAYTAIGTHGILVNSQWILTTKSAGITCQMSTLPYENGFGNFFIEHPDPNIDLKLIRLYKTANNYPFISPIAWASEWNQVEIALHSSSIPTYIENSYGFNDNPILFSVELDNSDNQNFFNKKAIATESMSLFLEQEATIIKKAFYGATILSDGKVAGLVTNISNEAIEFVDLTNQNLKNWVIQTIDAFKPTIFDENPESINFSSEIVPRTWTKQLIDSEPQELSSGENIIIILDNIERESPSTIVSPRGILIDTNCILTSLNIGNSLIGKNVFINGNIYKIANVSSIEKYRIQLLYLDKPVLDNFTVKRLFTSLPNIYQKHNLVIPNFQRSNFLANDTNGQYSFLELKHTLFDLIQIINPTLNFNDKIDLLAKIRNNPYYYPKRVYFPSYSIPVGTGLYDLNKGHALGAIVTQTTKNPYDDINSVVTFMTPDLNQAINNHLIASACKTIGRQTEKEEIKEYKEPTEPAPKITKLENYSGIATNCTPIAPHWLITSNKIHFEKGQILQEFKNTKILDIIDLPKSPVQLIYLSKPLEGYIELNKDPLENIKKLLVWIVKPPLWNMDQSYTKSELITNNFGNGPTNVEILINDSFQDRSFIQTWYGAVGSGVFVKIDEKPYLIAVVNNGQAGTVSLITQEDIHFITQTINNKKSLNKNIELQNNNVSKKESPKFETLEENKAVAKTGTLIDSRWILTSKSTFFEKSQKITGLKTIVKEVVDIPDSEFRLVFLNAPVAADVVPIERYRPKLVSNTKLKYIKQEGTNDPELKNITIRATDLQSLDGLKFAQTTGNVSFLGSGFFISKENGLSIAGVVTNLNNNQNGVTTIDTYQLTEAVNTFIDNKITEYATKSL